MAVMSFVSVTLRPDQPGALGDMAHRLAAQGVNIEGFSVESGQIHFLTHQPDQALRTLVAAGYPAHMVDALRVTLANRPGVLAMLLQRLEDEDIHVMSTFGLGHGDEGTIYVRCDDADNALPIIAAFDAPQATV